MKQMLFQIGYMYVRSIYRCFIWSTHKFNNKNPCWCLHRKFSKRDLWLFYRTYDHVT